jgi:hypothetical protein
MEKLILKTELLNRIKKPQANNTKYQKLPLKLAFISHDERIWDSAIKVFLLIMNDGVLPSTCVFSTIGNLNVQLIEVIDINESSKRKMNTLLGWRRKQQSDDERKYVHVEISIRDYTGKIIALNQTMTKTLSNGTQTLNLGEEFIFESVLSISSLTIALCVMTGNPSDIASKISAIATIPISRLEENKKVIQWYQMIDPSTNDGLRTAIRIMV